jgi:hypothetical protein
MLRIVSRGLQDIERLNTPIGNPTTTFYTKAIKRRTRWASQWRRVEFDNLADFGRRATTTLPVLGELITRITLVVDLPDIFTPQHVAAQPPISAVGPHWSWTNGIGHAICSSVELTIGDTVIDRLDSRLLEVLDEQTRPVEHFDSTNAMIERNPSDYTDQNYKKGFTPPYNPAPSTLEIIFPFWFNRGPGPQALPIEALKKDGVQLTVQFRDVQDLVYTSTAPGGPLAAAPGSALPVFAGCPFLDGTGAPTGAAMPTSWHFRDAYWVVEYVSLEDREAAAFRTADLQIPIEQHIPVPVVQTGGNRRVRIPIEQAGLVRELSWVAQRVEAPRYNAYFLFSRDLSGDDLLPGQSIWWPDAQIPNWDYGNGYIRPGFANRRSDPIAAATLWTRGVRRFDHEAPSFFRSLLPALGCARTPLIDRYIYRYDFGFWPTGGLAEALYKARDEVRGFANWDRIPHRELVLTMNLDECDRTTWEIDPTQSARTYGADELAMVEADFGPATEGFQFELGGSSLGGDADKAGLGARVAGIVDYQRIRRLPGFQNLYIRTNTEGSAALVAHATPNVWIAVAGGGGRGSVEARGGDAVDAASISFCGGNGAQTHTATANLGGGGGGRLAEAGVGLPDGTQMDTTDGFVLSHATTGGTSAGGTGGDGYYGGGSGVQAGGGGGSYVSSFVSQTDSATRTDLGDSYVVLTPLRRVRVPQPDFNIYAWLTRYNILRITGGRSALLFAE